MHSEITRQIMRANVADVERAARFAEHRVRFVRRPGRHLSEALRRAGDTSLARWAASVRSRWANPQGVDAGHHRTSGVIVGPYVIGAGVDRSGE